MTETKLPQATYGRVLACPVCGREVVFSCHHDGQGFRSREMWPSQAAKKRARFGEDKERIQFTCSSCGYEGPMEIGMTVGNGRMHCAACSGWGLER